MLCDLVADLSLCPPDLSLTQPCTWFLRTCVRTPPPQFLPLEDGAAGSPMSAWVGGEFSCHTGQAPEPGAEACVPTQARAPSPSVRSPADIEFYLEGRPGGGRGMGLCSLPPALPWHLLMAAFREGPFGSSWLGPGTGLFPGAQGPWLWPLSGIGSESPGLGCLARFEQSLLNQPLHPGAQTGWFPAWAVGSTVGVPVPGTFPERVSAPTLCPRLPSCPASQPSLLTFAASPFPSSVLSLCSGQGRRGAE